MDEQIPYENESEKKYALVIHPEKTAGLYYR